MPDLALEGRKLRRIHVNQHVLRANKREGRNDPALICRVNSASLPYARRIDILDDAGHVLASVIQDEEHPLSCGARVWIETSQPVVLHEAC